MAMPAIEPEEEAALDTGVDVVAAGAVTMDDDVGTFQAVSASLTALMEGRLK